MEVSLNKHYMNTTIKILITSLFLVLFLAVIGLSVQNVQLSRSLRDFSNQPSEIAINQDADEVVTQVPDSAEGDIDRDNSSMSSESRVDFASGKFVAPGEFMHIIASNGSTYLPTWRLQSPDGQHSLIQYSVVQLSAPQSPFFEGGRLLRLVANYDVQGDAFYGDELPVLAELDLGPYTGASSVEWISDTEVYVSGQGGDGGTTWKGVDVLRTNGEVERLYSETCDLEGCETEGNASLF